ncbi:MAG: M48 family metallopeptidase, partial [Paracoccaceae bacterium]
GRFVRDHENWIRGKLADLPRTITPTYGDSFPLGGRDRLLERVNGHVVRIMPDALGVPGPEGCIGAKLRACCIMVARERLTERARIHADKLKQRIARITLRDTRSRWGSCSTEGNLMFSWRLAMAPPEVLDYVVAHEVAHLLEMNHSAHFWAQVALLVPGYRAPRRWLRDNGPVLLSYRFRGDS